MNTPTKTPVKEIYFLSPSASDICLLCRKSILTSSLKRKLWDKEGKKTVACTETESYTGDEINNTTDFSIVCRNCYERVLRWSKANEERKQMLKVSRDFAKTNYIRVKTKRLSKFSEREPKKMLFTSESSTPKEPTKYDTSQYTKFKGTVIFDKADTKETIFVPTDRNVLIRLCCTSDIKSITKHVLRNHDEARNAAKEHLLDQVNIEATSICNRDNTKFKLSNLSALVEFDYKTLKDELKNNSPLLHDIITTVAINPRLKRNSLKTPESLVPAMINSVNTLLMCRNQKMNSCSIFNSFILKRGKSNKMCFNRLSNLNLCISYNQFLKKHTLLGEGFKEPIIAWSNELSQAKNNIINELQSISCETDKEIKITTTDMKNLAISSNFDQSFFDTAAENATVVYKDESFSDSGSVEECFPIIYSSEDEDKSNNDIELFSQKTLSIPDFKIDILDYTRADRTIKFDTKFMIIGDNLDLKIKRRHMTKSRQNKDLHLFHTIAVKNRIITPIDIIGVPAKYLETKKDINLLAYFPNQNDEKSMFEEFEILVSRDLTSYIDELSWAKTAFPKYKKHQYMNSTKKKSEIKSLGIADKNESSSEGIVDIMHEAHEIIPGHGSENVLRTFFVGDLLTVERSQNAQNDQQDADTPSNRLEGIIPGLADFHTFGNFLEVLWHILYDTRSGADIGTLFQARNFLNARSVPSEPMKDINACEELIVKYSDALIIVAYQQFCKENSDFIKNMNDKQDKNAYKSMINKIVRTYVLPDVPELTNAIQGYKCVHCNNIFKKRNGLLKHIKLKHKNIKEKPKVHKTDDAILNYTKNALSLTYVLKNFIDSRKYADGERTIRLYKYLMMYFKIDSRTKYAYQSLHLLSQINDLLPPALSHELMWNRTVNNSGNIDANVELDRELEHRNKYAKLEIHSLQGNITENSLLRVSRSYQKIDDIVKNFDKNTNISAPSGKHTVADWKQDVLELAEQYKYDNLLTTNVGRYHSKFPGFPLNYMLKIDILDYKKWMQERIMKFNKLSIYQQKNLYTE